MYARSIVSVAALASLAAAKVQYLGVTIAGGDFGCEITGTCPTGSTQIPLGEGPGQMKHFVNDDGMNMFRLPISWQFLTNNAVGSTLDATALGKYDQLMQACLATGAHCMIDIHNYARWNGGIIGQGGPTDDAFVSLWTQLATKYASESKVVFELMNEPHDLDIAVWAATCQKAVTAIRNAGASSQMILLPGTNFDSAATLVSSGSTDALLKITNPDGTTANLMLDVHKYLDTDNSGTHSTCTTDNVDAFNSLAATLRAAGRNAIVSETGASSDGTCMTAFCAQNTAINANSDVFVGLVAWAAGSFSTSYVLSLTPSKSGSSYVDNALMKQCVLGTWDTPASVPLGPISGTTPTSPAASEAQQTTPLTTPIPSSQPVQVRATTSDMVITMTGTATQDTPSTLLVATGTPVGPSGFTWAGGAGSTGSGMGGNATRTASPTRSASATTTVVSANGAWEKSAPVGIAVMAGAVVVAGLLW